MKLYVLRHGEAHVSASRDSQRELTELGREQVIAIASYFLEKNASVKKVICSPYVRAQQTAELFREVTKFNGDVVTTSDITPDISIAKALKTVGKHFECDLLMVSHQPLVSSLISYLVWGVVTQKVGMDTASLACLNTDLIEPGQATLEWVQHVSQLIHTLRS